MHFEQAKNRPVMEIRFDGKRALVTGAGKGIGRCIAKELSACGAHTIALSRTQADLDSLKAEDSRIETVLCDVSDWDETRRIVEGLGDIHLLVNNAAVLTSNFVLDVTPEEIDKLFSINVKAVFNISQVVVKEMIERKAGGSIVNISGLASHLVSPALSVYSGTKAALDQISKVMAHEWGPHQVRVNCVNPTVVMTDMVTGSLSEEQRADIKQRIPMRKFALDRDVSNAVLYLLSDRSDMITGTTLLVDGGHYSS